MNIKDVRVLAKIMSEYNLNYIEWKDENSSVMLKKDYSAGETVNKSTMAEISKMEPESIDMMQNKTGSIIDDKEDFNDIVEVKSPFVGVFYSTASLDNLPFVSIGSEVKEGDVMCIVESMKIMNEIVAPKDGKVIDICVKNKDIVEFGQVLYKLI